MKSIVLDKAVQSPANLCREYTRIPLKAIRLKVVENVDLYCKPGDGNTPILYCSGNYPICDRDIDELEQRGVKALYVTSACFGEVQKQLFKSLEELVSDERISPAHDLPNSIL